jgi:hypothetical protein
MGKIRKQPSHGKGEGGGRSTQEKANRSLEAADVTQLPKNKMEALKYLQACSALDRCTAFFAVQPELHMEWAVTVNSGPRHVDDKTSPVT